jgi:hypothetical protein
VHTAREAMHHATRADQEKVTATKIVLLRFDFGTSICNMWQ